MKKPILAMLTLIMLLSFTGCETKEEACLKSIASSLTQLPSIKKVKILIDHKDVSVLGGNYDISTPFGKDDIDGRKK